MFISQKIDEDLSGGLIAEDAPSTDRELSAAVWQCLVAGILRLLGRDVWGVATTVRERQQVLAALAQRGRWVTIYYGWRPNLPDEADNHLVELALAGGAAGIVTHNVRDLGRGERVFDQLRVLTPAQCLEEWL